MKALFGLLLTGLVVVVVALLARPSPAVKSSSSLTPAEAIQAFNLTGNKFRFSQEEITVKRGDKIRVNLTAVDMPHDFDVEGLNVDGPLVQPGETATVEFTADKVGEFEYYCSYGQHRANGMVGRLIVI